MVKVMIMLTCFCHPLHNFAFISVDFPYTPHILKYKSNLSRWNGLHAALTTIECACKHNFLLFLPCDPNASTPTSRSHTNTVSDTHTVTWEAPRSPARSPPLTLRFLFPLRSLLALYHVPLGPTPPLAPPTALFGSALFPPPLSALYLVNIFVLGFSL